MRAVWRSLVAPRAAHGRGQGLHRTLGTAACVWATQYGAGAGQGDAFWREKAAMLALAASGAALWAENEAADCQEQPEAHEKEVKEPKTRAGRRQLLKKRSKMKEKREEVDSMKAHLDEYRLAHKAAATARARFEHFASRKVAVLGKQVPAMTFTDFVHSLILPRYHTRSPVRVDEPSLFELGDGFLWGQ